MERGGGGIVPSRSGFCQEISNFVKGNFFLKNGHSLIAGVTSDIFLPCPDSLLVNLHESKELITELLTNLPSMFENTMDTGNALGAALQSAYKLMVS